MSQSHFGGLAAIRQRPILLAFICFWLLEAGMNAHFGYRRGSIALSAVLLSFAVVAAWLPIQIKRAWRQRSSLETGVIVCLPLVLAAAVCFLISQVAGWATLGTMLADGAMRRERAATQGSVADDKLKDLRDERKALGIQPTPEEVDGLINTQFAIYVRKAGETVGQATNKCADPSWAPTTCKKVAELEVQLAKARRAKQLDEAIGTAAGGLATTPAIAGGAPDVLVLQAIFGGEPRDITFWFTVFLASFIGFFANFGFAMAGIGDVPRRRRQPRDDYDWGPPRLAPPRRDDFDDLDPEPEPTQGGPAPGAAAFPPGHPSHPATNPYDIMKGWPHRDEHGYPVAPQDAKKSPADRFVVQAPPIVMPSQPPAAHHQHGSPINISLQMPGGAASPMTPAPQAPPTGSQLPTAPAVSTREELSFDSAPASAPLPPDAPVNRDHIRGMLDHFNVFRTACLQRSDAGVIDGDEMYWRYAAWAGDRAEPRVVFDEFFNAATGVERFIVANTVTWRGVALKEKTQLQLAAV